MTVHLINPSDSSFGTAVITPRWLYVLAAATPRSFGEPRIVDETLEALVLETIQAGDMVGIGIHTGNALRGYEVGRLAKERGAWVIFGGIHATLYPDEPFQYGSANVIVKGDGDIAWSEALRGCQSGSPQKVYEGGRIEAGSFLPARRRSTVGGGPSPSFQSLRIPKRQTSPHFSSLSLRTDVRSRRYVTWVTDAMGCSDS